MGLFTQIVILLIVLTAMVMVLLGIRELTHFEGFDNSEETRHLRDEVNENGKILSHNNIFHNLVEVEPEKVEVKKREEPHKSNSNDPFSRKE